MNLKNAIRVRQSLRIGHFRKPCNKNDEPGEKHGTCLKTKDKATFYSPTEVRIMPAHSSKKPEEGEIVVDSGASMHKLSNKDLSSFEMETLNTTTVITANGEVQTCEEQVYVHDLEVFVTVQILDDTPAALSSGKLCEEHGYTLVKIHILPKMGTYFCARQRFRSYCCPRNVIELERRTHRVQSPSPARLRSDDAHAQASGDTGDPPKFKNTKKKEGSIQATKWHQGSTILKLTSHKTEIAKSACE